MCGCSQNQQIPQGNSPVVNIPVVVGNCIYTVESVQALSDKLDTRTDLINYNVLKGFILSAINQPQYICSSFFPLIAQIEQILQ